MNHLSIYMCTLTYANGVFHDLAGAKKIRLGYGYGYGYFGLTSLNMT